MRKVGREYGEKGVQLLLTYEEFKEIYDRTDRCESCGTKFGSNNRKSDGKTIARIHPRGNYEADNIQVVCRAYSKGKPRKTTSKSSKKKAEVVNLPKLYQKPGAGYYFTFKGRQSLLSVGGHNRMAGIAGWIGSVASMGRCVFVQPRKEKSP